MNQRNKNAIYAFTTLISTYLLYDLQVDIDVTRIFTEDLLKITTVLDQQLCHAIWRSFIFLKGIERNFNHGTYLTIYHFNVDVIPVGNYMFKVINRNTRNRCEKGSKLTIKTLERHHLRCSGVFIVNVVHISHFFLVFLRLILNR